MVPNPDSKAFLIDGPGFEVLVQSYRPPSSVQWLNVTQDPPPLFVVEAGLEAIMCLRATSMLGDENVSTSALVTVQLHCTGSCANKVVSAVIVDFCAVKSPTLEEIARSLSWNESVSEIVSQFAAKVSENGGPCAFVTISSIINQLLALLSGDLGTILAQGYSIHIQKC